MTATTTNQTHQKQRRNSTAYHKKKSYLRVLKFGVHKSLRIIFPKPIGDEAGGMGNSSGNTQKDRSRVSKRRWGRAKPRYVSSIDLGSYRWASLFATFVELCHRLA